MNVRVWIAVVVMATMALGPGQAWAAPQCFEMFSGVYVMFNRPVTNTGTAALNGRIWGALAACDGLSSWPVVGSSHTSKTDGLVVAFRAFNVDATGCGAVDVIGTMKGTPLSGPFQLWNQRTNFGNTGTWTQIACPVPPEGLALPSVGNDSLGNSSK